MSEDELDMYVLQIGWLELLDLNNRQVTSDKLLEMVFESNIVNIVKHVKTIL